MSSASPLNVWSRSEEEIGRLMSNFAHTPFTLDGVEYASVESFYACLLIPPHKRERVAKMYGIRAKHEVPNLKPQSFEYRGQTIGLGTPQHPHPLQTAFAEEQAMQCGYCLNGWIMTAADLLAHEKAPSRARIKEALGTLICRCGAQTAILRAVERAAKEMSA